MKTKLILLAVTALLSLTSCDQLRQAAVVKAIPVTRPSYSGSCTATWGDPNVVHWVDNVNGHRWTSSYQDFFKYCGKRHPRELGIMVRGKLPDNIAHPAAAATSTPATVATTTEPISTEPPTNDCQPPAYKVPQ